MIPVNECTTEPAELLIFQDFAMFTSPPIIFWRIYFHFVYQNNLWKFSYDINASQ